jgi:hypothetical protein
MRGGLLSSRWFPLAALPPITWFACCRIRGSGSLEHERTEHGVGGLAEARNRVPTAGRQSVRAGDSLRRFMTPVTPNVLAAVTRLGSRR